MKESLVINLETAEKMVKSGMEKANNLGLSVVITILDAGGHLLIFKKMDRVQVASIEIAIKKARTAYLYKRATKIFQEQINQGNQALNLLPELLPFEGGIPVLFNDILIGSIGVSGAKPEEDGIIAKAIIEVLEN